MCLPPARASTNEVIYKMRSLLLWHFLADESPTRRPPANLLQSSCGAKHSVALLSEPRQPCGSRELVGQTRHYQLMDISHRQLRRMVDDQLREMYQHFVEQAVPPQIGQVLHGVSPNASFESSGQSQQVYEV